MGSITILYALLINLMKQVYFFDVRAPTYVHFYIHICAVMVVSRSPCWCGHVCVCIVALVEGQKHSALLYLN